MNEYLQNQISLLDRIIWDTPEEKIEKQSLFVKKNQMNISFNLFKSIEIDKETADYVGYIIARAIFVGEKLLAQGLAQIGPLPPEFKIKLGYTTDIKDNRVSGACKPIFTTEDGKTIELDQAIDMNNSEQLLLSKVISVISVSGIIRKILIKKNIIAMMKKTDRVIKNPKIIAEIINEDKKELAIEVERNMIEEVAHSLFWLECLKDKKKLHRILNELKNYPTFSLNETAPLYLDIPKDKLDHYESNSMEIDARKYTLKFLEIYYPDYTHLAI